MKLVATIEILVFYFTAFGLRSLWQWRKTGKTGFAGVRPGAGFLERGAAALMTIALLLAPLAPWLGAPLWTERAWFGLGLAAVGIVLTLLAQLQMGASWRIGVDESERTELVTTGVFAWVRNPIFSAMLLASIGLALAVPTPLALLLPLLLLLALELQVRLVEEPYLQRTHGVRYRAWAAETGRFLPRLGQFSAARRSRDRAPQRRRRLG
jgi:protein-S-isoprenylcysteine O-methyltransferase Ste14